MIDELDLLINQCTGAFNQDSAWKTGRELAFGALNCMGRHTLTGMLTASGQQFVDWSSAYRLFSRHRVDTSKLFEVVRSGVMQELGPQQMIVAHMDDTLLKKTGRHIPGTAWRRDPLGPPFQTNFVWGQRFLQISMALADHQGCSQSRAIPIDFHHCPTVKRPRQSAGEEDWKNYKEQQRKLKLSKQGSDRLNVLRDELDKQGVSEKQLIVSVDGSYTNAEVLKNLPDRAHQKRHQTVCSSRRTTRQRKKARLWGTIAHPGTNQAVWPTSLAGSKGLGSRERTYFQCQGNQKYPVAVGRRKTHFTTGSDQAIGVPAYQIIQDALP